MACRLGLARWQGALVCAAASLLTATHAAAPPVGGMRTALIATRVDAVLMRRHLGRDALAVIDNVIRHETPPPAAAPPVVREILADPLAALDAATLFDRSVPAGLRHLAAMAPIAIHRTPVAARLSVELTDLLAPYLRELDEARRTLQSAPAGTAIDGTAIVRSMNQGANPSAALRSMAATADAAMLERATALFIDATARFVQVLGERAGSLRFPDHTVQVDSAIGKVSIGTWGDDRHGPDAAVIIDPGGNDFYERVPTTGGAVSVIVDFSGNDRYEGSDLVVNGLSAIIDFSGNDRYTMKGPGLAAVIFGASLLVDLSGDDLYEAALFGQGAAAFGVGAVLDLSGNDRYRLQAVGQGFGMAHGYGLLWDRDGDDTYVVGGVRDAFDRGGGVSMAQGAARGSRTSLGGGIGILRDDAGNDVYEAEMFAQGMGFYYGVGLLWDREGNDHYRAVRYAQGNGVHEAVGILRDDAGNDRYDLGVGVGQGMGLDLAVGMLFDGAGDDRYQSPVLAQGAATANGVGILIDAGGADEWHMGSDRRSWGHAQWSRGLPSLGLLFYEPTRAAFTRDGQVIAQPASAAELGGPLGGTPVAHEAAGKPGCTSVAAAAADGGLPLAPALSAIAPGFVGGTVDHAIYAGVQRQLTTQLQASLAALPADDFNVLWSLTGALRCALVAATAEDAEAMWTTLEGVLLADAATPFAGPIVAALVARAPSATQADRITRMLDKHPQCSVRAAAVRLRHALDAPRTATVAAAQAALGASCWQLQAAGLRVLKTLDIAQDAGSRTASFLREYAVEPESGERERVRAGEGESESK